MPVFRCPVSPAPGQPYLARRALALIGEQRAALSESSGLDHGTWTVLHHLRPAADCPVVQLSIDERLAPAAHLELGRALAPLRDEGVLVMGSRNITHNLRHAFGAWGRGDTATPDRARTFDTEVAKALGQRDGGFLARAVETEAGKRSHPTLDHYLPLLYAAGAAFGDGSRTDAVSFPIEGLDMSSLSMRAVPFGQAGAGPPAGTAGTHPHRTAPARHRTRRRSEMALPGTSPY